MTTLAERYRLVERICDTCGTSNSAYEAWGKFVCEDCNDAYERGPWPMTQLPEPDWNLIIYTTTGRGGDETRDAPQRRQEHHDEWHAQNPDRVCEYME